MVVFGILSLVQVVLLPGVIALRLIRFRGTFWQTLIYTFALSLFINYCAIFLFAAFNIYSRPLVMVLFVVQLIWAGWLYRQDLQRPLPDFFQNLWDRSRSALSGLFPSPEGTSQPQRAVHLVYMLFTLVALIVALDRIWWAWGVFLDNIGTIFTGWDAVYSWNRWAQAWFAGSIPADTRFYPQLVPANWSLTYIFMGETTLQLFAKFIMPVFLLGMFLQLFDLGITLRQPGFFVAIILLRSLVVRFIGSGIDDGYIDTAVAFFGLLPIYTILKAQAVKMEADRRVLWVLGLFFAAAATVTKQAGVYIFPITILLTYLYLLRPYYGKRDPALWRDLLTWGVFALLVPLSWYGFKLVLIMRGADMSEVLANAGYTAQVYGNVGVALQIRQALEQFGAYFVLFPLILFSLPILPSVVRWLFFLLVLPFPIVWAVMASYATRNLALSVPFLALAGGLAVEAVFRLSLRLPAWTAIGKLRLILVPAVSVILLFILAYVYPDSCILAYDMAERQELFSPSLNRELKRLFDADPNTLILTNYPVAYVLGREDGQVTFWYGDAQEFERLMQNDNITHLLVPTTSINAGIADRIDQWVDEGYLKFLLQDRGSSVIPYRLYVIQR